MDLFAEDCTFEASGGDVTCGTRHEGMISVRDAFAEVLRAMPDAAWANGRHHPLGPGYGVRVDADRDAHRWLAS